MPIFFIHKIKIIKQNNCNYKIEVYCMKKFYIALLSLSLGIIALMLACTSHITFAKTEFDNISAKSYIIMDSSGNVLIDKNADEKHEVASICKLMTTLITLEYLDKNAFTLEDEFVASSYACSMEGSQAFLDANSKYKVRDLIKSVIVASANDSAVVLAENIAGSENTFVDMMNKKAKELGMNNTLYANSTGLHDGTQYSTARDTAILLDKVSKYDLYKEDCKIWLDKLVHPSGRETELVNTNRLVKYYPYCKTGKTGFTDEAGYCLSSTASKNNLDLTCVVLGCDTMANRFKESIVLYNYAFANFVSDMVANKNDLLENNIKVVGGKATSVKIQVQDDYYVTQDRNNKKEITTKLVLPSSIKAPLKTGDVVGEYQVIADGKVLKTIPVIVANDVQKQSYKDVLNKIIKDYPVFNN